MENDLPEDRNGYMAHAYAELAHQARLRANDTLITVVAARGLPAITDRAEHDAIHEAAGKLQRLADVYGEQYNLSTGYHAK